MLYSRPSLSNTATRSSLNSFQVDKLNIQFLSYPDRIQLFSNYMWLSHWKPQDISIKAENSIREHCSRVFTRFVNLSPISVDRYKGSNTSRNHQKWYSTVVIIGWETSCLMKWKFTLKKYSVLYLPLRTQWCPWNVLRSPIIKNLACHWLTQLLPKPFDHLTSIYEASINFPQNFSSIKEFYQGWSSVQASTSLVPP